MRSGFRLFGVTCASFVLAVCLASPASAAIVLVRSLGDGPANAANCPGAGCRLRDAIAAAASGDTIDFASGLSGTVSLQFAPGELVIDKDLHIWGPGPDQNALVIAAPGGSRVLTVASGVSLSLHFLYVRSGTLSTSGDGGNIYNQGTLTLDHVTVDSGTARNGGCLYSAGPSLTIRNSLFQSCFANGGGAAIYATGSQRVLIDRTSFFSNTAVSGNGGAVALASVVQTHILNSTFSGNSSNQASGGALSIDGGTAFLVNSSFSQNNALSSGQNGAHVASATAIVYAVNSTLADGGTQGSGGGFFVSAGALRLYNTIVWRNNSGAPSTKDCGTANGGTIVAESSVSGVGTGCPQGGTNLTAATFPDVVTFLANNGGPTRTYALASPSVAADSGDNNFLTESFLGLDLNGDGDTTDTITRDQRGVQRPQNGATDIGAFESGLTTFVTAPDLVVRKSHAGASIQAPPASWTWILEIENVGDGAASFLTTQRVFTDPQPTVSTFTVSTQSAPGLAGSISPGTIGDSTFAQAGPSGATLAPGGRIVIAIPVTQNSVGTFTNPTPANATVVDPNNVVAESNETNNAANQDTVTVALPDLTVAKSNDVSGVALLGGSWTWQSTVVNVGGFAATFSSGQVLYRDNLPTSGLTYSAPTAVPVSGITGSASCIVASNVLTCTASGAVTFAAGGSIRFDVTTTPNAGTAGTTFTNPSTTATVDPDGVVTESDENNNNAAANSVFVIAPDLRVFKSNSVSGATTLGNNWTWTAQILNQGVGQATFTNGQVILSDALPSTNITYGSPTISTTVSGTVTCSISGSLLTCAATGTVTFGLGAFLRVDILATPSTIGTFTNPTNGAATVDPNDVVPEVLDGNNDALANSVVVTAPDLTVTKMNDVGGQTTFPTGWTWRATLANGGNATATFSTGQVMYSDALPSTGVSYGAAAVGNPVGLSGTVTCGITAATLSCTAGSTVTLNAGGSFTVDVAATPTAAGTFTNPTAGPATADPNNVVTESNEANNAATPNTVVVLGSADLSATKDDGVTRVEAGGTTTYQIVVSNAGPNDVTGASVSDPMPAACTSLTWTCSATSGSCGAASGTGAIATTVDLLKNGSATFLVTCAVSANATGTLENVVTVAVPQGTVDLNGQNNQATDKDAIVHPALSLSKTTTATSFTGPGDVLAYTLVATNSGDVTLSQVQISDPLLPALTCTPGQPATLAPNATLTCTGSYTVTGADVLAGQVTNTATVTGTWDDAAAGGNLLFAAPEALVPVVAQATVVVPGIAPAMTAPRLAFQTCTVELQQDWTPRYTKLQFEVWNEDEVKFTGAFECADTWHETDFGASVDAASQNFTIGVLGTYGARYRVQAVTSTQCPEARASGILAVQSVLAGPNAKAIGATLAGAGKFTGSIRWDPAAAVPEGGIR